MKDTYDPHDTEAVAAYERRVELQRNWEIRNGEAVMSVFMPLASAADPKSALGRFTRWAPFIVTGIIVVFAGAVALGFV